MPHDRPPRGEPRARVVHAHCQGEAAPPHAARHRGDPAGTIGGDLAALVAAERMQQGLGPQITDLAVLSRLAARVRSTAEQGDAAVRAEHGDTLDGNSVRLAPISTPGDRVSDGALASTPVPRGRSPRASVNP